MGSFCAPRNVSESDEDVFNIKKKKKTYPQYIKYTNYLNNVIIKVTKRKIIVYDNKSVF